jgi:TonB family protein
LHARIGCVVVAVVIAKAEEQIPTCFKELATPVYPPLASLARVQGDVVLKFSVDASGNPVGIATDGHKLLVPGALRAIEAVRFSRKECGGRQFSVRYQFEISDSPASAFVPPSGFRVTTVPRPVILQYSNVSHDETCLKPLIGKLSYEPLARSASVQGIVEAVFHLDAKGAVESTELQGHKLLTGGVKMQVRELQFDVARCGTRVPVTLQFQLKDPESHDGKSTVTFQEPGMLVITAHKAARNH